MVLINMLEILVHLFLEKSNKALSLKKLFWYQTFGIPIMLLHWPALDLAHLSSSLWTRTILVCQCGIKWEYIIFWVQYLAVQAVSFITVVLTVIVFYWTFQTLSSFGVQKIWLMQSQFECNIWIRLWTYHLITALLLMRE